MKFTANDKKDLVKEIDNLSNDEHIEIFKIIKNFTDKYTKNDNGIFINISVLDNDTIEKIYKFVNFCKDNKEKLEKNEEFIRSEKNKMFGKNTIENNNNEIDKFKNLSPILQTSPILSTSPTLLTSNDSYTINNLLDNIDTHNDKTTFENTNIENIEDENMDEEKGMEGIKISLKRLKPKYVGIKAKIIKNYKQNNNNMQNIIYNKNKFNTNSLKNITNENEYDIGEEIYNDTDDIEDCNENCEENALDDTINE